MTIDSINNLGNYSQVGNESYGKNDYYNQNPIDNPSLLPSGVTNMFATAQSMGLTVDSYYRTDSSGNVSVNTYALKADIEAEEAKQNESKEDQDVFVNAMGNLSAEEAKSEASSKQKEIDNEYESAFKQYAASLQKNEDDSLAAEWDQLESQAERFTSVTASNQSILEGFKGFLNKLEKAISHAESVSQTKDEEEDIKLDLNENIFDMNASTDFEE